MDLDPYNCVAVVESQSYNSDGVMFEYAGAAPPGALLLHHRVEGSRRSGDDCVAGRYSFGREEWRGDTHSACESVSTWAGYSFGCERVAQGIAEEQRRPTPAPANPLQPPGQQGDHGDNGKDEKRAVHHATGLAQPK